jgi:hypothetical protein
MAEFVKFSYVIIIFIFLLLVLREVDGKPFLSLTNFLLYFIHNISSQVNYILFFFFPFNIIAGLRCLRSIKFVLSHSLQTEVYQFPM